MEGYVWWSLALILLFLYCLYPKKFLYYTRLVLYNYGVFLSVCYGLIRALPKPNNHRNIEYAAGFLHYWTKLVLNIKYEILGLEHMESVKKPVIIVANHQSSLDIIVSFDTFYYPVGTCVTVQKRLLQYFPIYGWFFKRCRTIFLGKRKTAGNVEYVVAQVKHMLSEKINVLMYAEGTRNSGEILPFQKGPFHVAIESKVTILPIVYSNYSNIVNRNKDKEFKYGGKVIVQALPPVSTDGLTSADVQELTQRVRNDMIKVYNEISSKAKTD